MYDYPDKFRYFVHNNNYTDTIVQYDITSFDILLSYLSYLKKRKKKKVGIGL